MLIPNFQAISEFGGGFTDTCGPAAALMALHVVNGTPLTYAKMNAMRAREIAAGTFHPAGSANAGINIDNLALDLTTNEGVAVDLMGYTETLDLVRARALVDAYLALSDPVILEVGRAGNLPFNEPNITYHFITLGGRDASGNYYFGNGDDVAALQGQTFPPVRVATWDQLVAAHIVGVCSVFTRGNKPVTVQERFTPRLGADGKPDGWYVDKETNIPIFRGFYDELVARGDLRPVIASVRLYDDVQDSRIIVGDFNTGGNAIYIFDAAHKAATADFPGNALIHTESQLDAAFNQIKDLHTQNDALSTELTKAHNALSDLEGNLHDAETQIQQLKAQLAAVQDASVDATAIEALRAALLARGSMA